jgi:two-component system, NarL family, response regulator DegU
MTIRLMLADDHTMLRQGLRRALEEDGAFEVVAEAASGDEAVRLASAMRPQVILMDVSMPFMDGVAATREITSRFPEVRVVMLTMFHDAEVAHRALRAGATGYLVKDCSLDEVRNTITMAASRDSSVSPDLAASMLTEARRLRQLAPDDEKAISKREEEVLQLIADGLSTPEVAERLYISQKTVKNHLASIYEKLDARDRTQAVLQAVRRGIVRLN